MVTVARLQMPTPNVIVGYHGPIPNVQGKGSGDGTRIRDAVGSSENVHSTNQLAVAH